jgi:hypothetical protein
MWLSSRVMQLRPLQQHAGLSYSTAVRSRDALVMTSIDDDGIAAVVLNRPTKFNSLSLEMFKGESKSMTVCFRPQPDRWLTSLSHGSPTLFSA